MAAAGMTIWAIGVSTLTFITDNHAIQDRVTQLFSSDRIRYEEDSPVPFFPEFSPDLTGDFWDVRAPQSLPADNSIIIVE